MYDKYATVYRGLQSKQISVSSIVAIQFIKLPTFFCFLFKRQQFSSKLPFHIHKIRQAGVNRKLWLATPYTIIHFHYVCRKICIIIKAVSIIWALIFQQMSEYLNSLIMIIHGEKMKRQIETN